MKKTNDSIEQALTDREKPIKEFNLEDVLESQDLHTKLTNELKHLNDKERLLLTLRYQEKLSIKQISEIFRCTPSNVSKFHRKILIHLKRKLEN